jgi:predicted ester cyclase
VSSPVHDDNRELIGRFRRALYDLDPGRLASQLETLFAPDARIQLGWPLGSASGPGALFEQAYRRLIESMPDLERRDYIVMAGPDEDEQWVACAGYYIGLFEKPWLDIPATRHLATMRYCEFFQIEDDRIVAMHGLWDIPELMIQARAWPLSPSLGRVMHVPGPATQDGILSGPYDAARAAASMQLVDSMVEGLGRFAEGGTEAMQLNRYWHPKMNWYGPAGIGSSRRLSGFRNWHQIPFLAALPNRGSNKDKPHRQCFFADGDYVAFCGFNAMHMNVTGDGWLGIAPSNQRITMTSLDFWRCEGGRIRENWVLVDLLDVYRQLGVDVFRRMREYTVDRQLSPPAL